MKRKYYLDYLRVFSILLLFPVHTFMIWNDYGLNFYIWGGENRILSTLIVIVNPWFMPILFVIAGICMRFSLKKRTVKELVKERVKKLLIPFVICLSTLIPIQTLYARKFHMNYKGGLLENLTYFFTHLTDLSGYDGAFTPAHLWFILFLFVITLISLVIIKILPYKKISKRCNKFKIWQIVAMFVFVWLMYYIGNFGGFSIGKNLILFLFGYYILSNEEVMNKLKVNSNVLMLIFLLSTIGLVIAYYKYSYYGDFFVNFEAWIGICALLGFGGKYLNKNNKVIAYLSNASFPVYIMHQTILVIIGYYTLLYITDIKIQVIIIMLGSFAVTFLIYEIMKKISHVRFLIGEKNRMKKTKKI